MMDLLDELAEEAAAQEGAVALDSAFTADLLRRTVDEIKRLHEDLGELLEDAFCELAHKVKYGDRQGWWDTCADATAKIQGDRLVDLGLWEKHLMGHVRRWWYRPVNAKQRRRPAMDGKQRMELTVRTSLLMKAVARMSGVKDTGLAKLHMAEIGEAAMELNKFIEACE